MWYSIAQHTELMIGWSRTTPEHRRIRYRGRGDSTRSMNNHDEYKTKQFNFITLIEIMIGTRILKN